MEVSSVIDIRCLWIYDRIVAGGIQFLNKNLLNIVYGILYRTQDLRNASERIIALDLLLEDLVRAGMEEFILPLLKAFAAFCKLPHQSGNLKLSAVPLGAVDLVADHVVVG